MRFRLSLFFIVVWTTSAFAQVDFDRYFIDNTMRVDYHHTGTRGEEIFSLDKIFKEGPWPGSKKNLIDTLNLGEFLVRVYDLKSGQLLYSRGFSTIFNEWQTTPEAGKGVWKSFHESVRFPFPKRAVQLTISRRNKYLIFEEKFSTVIQPDDPAQVSIEKRTSTAEVITLIDNGNIHKKVDILIIGDGYAAGDINKFKADAKHFNDVMFDTSPFKERKNDFNVRALCAVSEESGIDKPDLNIWKNTILGCQYNTFGSERYILTEENRQLRDLASAVPYDFICILVNDNRYGGGGIYQLYTTTYTTELNKGHDWQRDYVYVHEFGHSFGGLADEYYSSSTGYEEFYPAGVEPWEPNITRLLDRPWIKWQQDVTPGLQIPTDWGKTEYDDLRSATAGLDFKASDFSLKRDSIIRRIKEISENPDLLGKVGAFEGAGYLSEGMYRPSLDCRMFSLTLGPFCRVCATAIERQIDFYCN